ncbi:hypothetical protein L596_027126 [Steinernema carpocapsae]|uniref:Uncharacterized protein n=1 Tax=Steinernema carpocapsae TaxID=34508 RepID=A0A4U5M3E1_STECR|nr:hypothetical protein L596_027126 [Steinernema carpocapsae]
MTAITQVLLPGLMKHQFERIDLGYYGQVSEDFITAQVKNGSPDLTLTGKWPASIKNLLKTYINKAKEPRITLDQEGETRFTIDENLFDLLFDKFVKGQLYLRNIYGDLGFTANKLRELRPYLQVKNAYPPSAPGKPVYGWKSPKNSRELFIVQFIKNGVEIFTFVDVPVFGEFGKGRAGK